MPQASSSFWWWLGFALTAISTAIACVRWYLASKASKEATKARQEAQKAKHEARQAKNEARKAREGE